MRQYFSLKAQHPDAILLYRVGDFYETFGSDAVKASEVLGIVLTSRNNGGSDLELAGFPYHSLDVYLPKLVQAGFRVAICEQLEKPVKGKKVVDRGITEVVTPGLAVDETILDHKKNNFLASLHFAPRNFFGVAFLDVSTGEFLVSEGDKESIEKLFQSFSPAEVILSRSSRDAFTRQFGDDYHVFGLDEWVYTSDYANEKLRDHFDVASLKGFGVDDLEAGQIAAGACLQYLNDTQHTRLRHIQSLSRIQPEQYLWMDRFTIRNLELVNSAFPTGKALIDILDSTLVPMGSRMMRQWMLLPERNLTRITARHAIVEYLIKHGDLFDDLTSQIKSIGDLQRLITRVAMRRVSPRELKQLQRALMALAPVKQALDACSLGHLKDLADRIHPCTALIEKIEVAISDEAPANINKGNAIKEGFHDGLDDLRYTIRNSKDLLVQIQQEEAARTGIASLKIGFNNVFGYYLEVTNKYKDQGLVPDDWVRKQTLTNAERYITDALKKLEQKILSAEDKIQQLETDLFNELVEEAQQFVPPIQHNALVVAQLDCLMAFASNAMKFNYVMPEMHEEESIAIEGGRHPVIERQLPLGEAYVPNDVSLNSSEQQILMITGPNMSGKSAVLRQTALICIMAQMGSFVPASSARLSVLDKLFTRVGASDNISSGESTFMVEMHETASIMHSLNSRSLILLDEIGRGTSTYDGISIAWAVAEYLHDNPFGRPMTLFATHYHELNALSDLHHRIHNYHVAVKEVGSKVIFLRKLVEGGSEHSFGIHVARMAGMPQKIIARAYDILQQMEQQALSGDGSDAQRPKSFTPEEQGNLQLSIFEHVDPVAGKLKELLLDLEVNQMTPIECMLKLVELKKVLSEDGDLTPRS